MFLIFLVLFSILDNSASAASNGTNEITKVLDNSSITISLANYNVSNPDGESVDIFHTSKPDSLTEITVEEIPLNVHFIVLQAHSFLINVTLSLDKIALSKNSISGTNVGLIKMNDKSSLKFYLTYNNSEELMDVLITVQAYSINAPIPGGCNMEFPVEISPFMLTTFNEAVTEVSFSPSAPPFSLSRSLFSNNECNAKLFPVQHKTYRQYLPERDFTKETYFAALKSMMTMGRILENGRSVPDKLTGAPTKKIFATYPGTGSVFVVISEFGNGTAAYVPSFTYGCYDLKDDNTCMVLTTTFSKILCATVLFLGLFSCFGGHYFFRVEIFLFGFLSTGIVTYILVSLLFSNAIALPASVSMGLFVAGVILIFCTVLCLPIMSIALTTLTLGFVVASIILEPAIDYVDLFVSDINFWGIFIGIVLALPILMMSLAEKANIIACAFLGSYVSIMSIDHYIGSNLRYIVFNTIRRAIVEKFKLAIVTPPFGLKDILLCVLWAALMLSGIKVQGMLMRNKPPYPPPVNPLKNFCKRWRRPPQTSQPSEVTPFLRDISTSSIPNYTEFDKKLYAGDVSGSPVRRP